MEERTASIKPTDLRGILNYVPRFLGQTFVIALDGAIIEHDNLPNILLDIAVLRSLQINVIIVHGIGSQLGSLSSERNIPISNADGNGITDKATLDLAIRSSARASHQILESLTQAGLKTAITNSVRAKRVGIIKGEDRLHTGQADRIDAEFLTHLISKNIVPIIQPIGFDRNGHSLRINSDSLAVAVAESLDATKVVFLTNEDGLKSDRDLLRQLSAQELETLLEQESATLSDSMKSKSAFAISGIEKGIARIHILDGRIHDGLIREVFSNEGVGTLIYGNEYRQIRSATRDDVPLIYHLTRSAVLKEELLDRGIERIENGISQYYVYEIDGNIIACLMLRNFEDAPALRELSSLFVHPLYQKRGIGAKLVSFACQKAKDDGAQRIIALSTQSFAFFEHVCGFREGDASILPAERHANHLSNSRQSKVLFKDL